MLKNINFTKNVIRSNSGVSLVEVLVAFGILAIIATGVTSLLTNGMKQQKGIQAKDQQREITAEVRSLIGKKAACLNSFGGGNPTAAGFSRNSIRDDSAAPGVARYTKNLTDKTKMLKFDDFIVHSFLVDPSDPGQGNATLDIKLSKVGDVGSVKEIKPDLITLKVKLNGAGNIIECFSLGARGDSVWQTSANLMDIFYYGGNVGIGTNAPVAKLQVMDTVSGLTTGLFINPFHQPGVVAGTTLDAYDGDGTTVRSLELQGNGGNVGIGTRLPAAKLDVAGNLAMNGKDTIQAGDSWLRLNQSGSFASGTHTPRNFNASGVTVGPLYVDPGLGNLEVSGTIKPGAASTGAGCGQQGAFAFDFGTNAPVFCNGSNWTSMGGALTSYAGANPGCPGGTSPFLKHWPAQWVPVSGVGAGCTTPEGWTGPPPVCEGCNNFEQCHFGYATAWDSIICR